MSVSISRLPLSDFTFDIRNATGSTLSKGSLLYLSGFDTPSNRFLVDKADSADPTKPSLIVIDIDLPNGRNGTGYVNRLVTDLNTSGGTVGSSVYLSPNTPGQFVFTPNPGHLVGLVEVQHASLGIVMFFLGGAAGGVSGYSGYSGWSGQVGPSGFSGFSGVSGASATSGFSGFSGTSGTSGFSGRSGTSGFSGTSAFSGFSGLSGFSGIGFSGPSGPSGFSGISGIGFSGPSGPSGPSGFSGFSSISGFSGVSGYSGEGFSGPQGISGFSGSSGFSSDSGLSGSSGFSGTSGYSGSFGPSGFSGQGASGFSGISGFSSQSGASGYSGFSGDSGFSGIGFSGPSGPSGPSGVSGFSSQSGVSGTSGFSGASGYSGQGISGFSGTGESGFSGLSGPSGPSGLSGFSGTSGFSGSFSGESGFSGPTGLSGFSGAGFSGFSGISGFSGPTGSGIVEQAIEVLSSTTGVASPIHSKVGKLDTISFQSGIDNASDFVFEIPSNANITNDIVVSLAYDMSSTNGGNVILKLDYEVVDNGQTSAPGSNTGSITNTLTGLASANIKAKTTFTIPHADLSATSNSIHFTLTRSGGTDTHTGDFRLETINVRYTGLAGPSGFSGYSGTIGAMGPSGQSGTSGTSGFSAPSGISGFSGGGGGGSVGANYPSWTKVTKTFTDLSTAATTNNIQVFSLPAGGVIHGVKIKHSTSFTGGSLSAYTVSIGITGNLNKYATAFDVFQATGDTVFQLSDSVGSEDHGSATSIKIAAISTGDNLNAATQGSVDVWLLTSVAI